MTSGLQPSELIIIAARPSMGKTAWAINIAENAAVRDGKVVGDLSRNVERSRCCDHAGFAIHGQTCAIFRPDF